MKKVLCIIAAALCLTFLASGILSGCDANNSASAANAGKNTVKKIDNTMGALETMEDKDFGFPGVLGNDFFVEDSAEPAGVDTETTSRRLSQRGYRAKHLGNRKLNPNGTARTKYLDKVDDLYVLCADISAANADCAQIAAAIRQEAKTLRALSDELKKSGKKGKLTFSKFNAGNRQLNESVTKLYRDRNRIKAAVKGAKTRGAALDVEASTMRGLMIMAKLENRLKLLRDTHEKLVLMNNEVRFALGKGSESEITSAPPIVPAPQTAPDQTAPTANHPPKAGKPSDETLQQRKAAREKRRTERERRRNQIREKQSEKQIKPVQPEQQPHTHSRPRPTQRRPRPDQPQTPPHIQPQTPPHPRSNAPRFRTLPQRDAG